MDDVVVTGWDDIFRIRMMKLLSEKACWGIPPETWEVKTRLSTIVRDERNRWSEKISIGKEVLGTSVGETYRDVDYVNLEFVQEITSTIIWKM